MDIYKVNKYLLANRVVNNITQKEVSEALGYSSAQFVSNVERNLCLPSLVQLKVWAKFVKADPKKCAQLLLDVHKEMIIEKTGIKF